MVFVVESPNLDLKEIRPRAVVSGFLPEDVVVARVFYYFSKWIRMNQVPFLIYSDFLMGKDCII